MTSKKTKRQSKLVRISIKFCIRAVRGVKFHVSNMKKDGRAGVVAG